MSKYKVIWETNLWVTTNSSEVVCCGYTHQWEDDYEEAKALCSLYSRRNSYVLWEEQDEEYHLFCGYYRDGQWQVDEQYEGSIKNHG